MEDVGSPPRVRSRLTQARRLTVPGRITSACAEQTRRADHRQDYRQDHLRVCGADSAGIRRSIQRSGSPPRVRSRHGSAAAGYRVAGITSACAEQTSSAGPKRPCRRDHLRVCGADIPTRSAEHDQGGSPPRVRSRRRVHRVDGVPPGITSACAEQTRSAWRDQGRLRDHLRVCGADPFSSRHIVWRLGSPPRVRSRQLGFVSSEAEDRITSACAEQTGGRNATSRPRWDHLRVCGADGVGELLQSSGGGSPPRVRSRHHGQQRRRREGGITSACAEQTIGRSISITKEWDHLRVCGADTLEPFRVSTDPGSPPRVRSRPRLYHDALASGGITSACAEQTG